MFLPTDIFQTIVSNAPLISIDFIVRNSSGKILLGRRVNPPAKNYWFVPGGRIYKNESIEKAFSRLTKAELDIELEISKARFKGVYEHMYSDSIFSGALSTHYIVLAYWIDTNAISSLPDKQHSDYLWMTPEELKSDNNVHLFSKNYFED